jgi:hypothetical protein
VENSAFTHYKTGRTEIKVPDELTVQIHILDLLDRQQGEKISHRVPALAVWVPEVMGVDMLVQDLPT